MADQTTTTKRTPRVPHQTPMYDESGAMSRTWIIFFERMAAWRESGRAGPFIRTLVLKDLTVGNNIADHVPVFVTGDAVRIVGVLRNSISADLTVRFKLDGEELLTVTIIAGTPVDQPVVATGPFTPPVLGDLGVLSFDIVASDGQTDVKGVATFTVQWQ